MNGHRRVFAGVRRQWMRRTDRLGQGGAGMAKRSRTAVGISVFWIFVLMVVPFMARPLTAASRSTAPDVAQIAAFVREQVQRHGIPGLALALVDGDRIIHLGGYGKADQTGRAVTPQTPFIVASVSKPLTALAVM